MVRKPLLSELVESKLLDLNKSFLDEVVTRLAEDKYHRRILKIVDLNARVNRVQKAIDKIIPFKMLNPDGTLVYERYTDLQIQFIEAKRLRIETMKKAVSLAVEGDFTLLDSFK